MIATRLTGCVLAAGVLATAAACGPATHGAAERAAAPKGGPPPSETLSPLTRTPLPNVPGKTFTSAIVSFPPGARAAPHRHGEAFVYAYVLEGTVASRIEGAPRRTYHRGEDWTEQPEAHHVLTENTSGTRPAKLLVVFVSNTGDPLKVDDPPK